MDKVIRLEKFFCVKHCPQRAPAYTGHPTEPEVQPFQERLMSVEWVED
jgi:hypothetical protein